MSVRETTLHCTRRVRDLWPNPLARRWAEEYPHLFDDDDVRLSQTQPRNHFAEWFAAIHVFQRDGAYALVEKYAFRNHPRKVEVYGAILSAEQRTLLGHITDSFRVQPPDLLLYMPDYSRVWFAEVKGPGDRVQERQAESHAAIMRDLALPVELITISVAEHAVA